MQEEAIARNQENKEPMSIRTHFMSQKLYELYREWLDAGKPKR